MGIFGDLFGGKQKRAGRLAQTAAGKTAGQVAAQAGKYGPQYDAGTAASMGANAGEMMQKAQAAASGLAEQQGQTAATQGSRAALQAARSGGLNPGQAALVGAQKAGDLYTGTYGAGLERGMERYGQNTQQFAQQGAEMANRQLGGAGLQAQIGGQQYAQGQQKGQSWLRGIGQIAGAGAAMLSDERAKDIERAKPDIAAILAKIDPVRFAYKGEGGVDRIGVTAQNVEETPLKAAVVNTPTGKRLDTATLTGSNLAMLADVSKRLAALEARLGGKRG